MKIALLIVLMWSWSSAALTSSEAAPSPEFESVVFYRVSQYDTELKQETSGYCNGHLLSDRVMVTAAHCVFMAEALKSKVVDIEVGEYKKFGYAVVHRQSLDATFLFVPELKSRLIRQGVNLSVGPQEDLAVVIFSEAVAVKANFHFGSVISQAHAPSVLRNILNYWPTVVTINPIEEISNMETKRMARLDKVNKGSGYFESKSQSRVKPGDSGAPLFVRVGSDWKQIGVTKGRAETIFSNWDVFPYFDKQLCRMSEQTADSLVRGVLCP